MKMRKLFVAIFLTFVGLISFNLPSANALGGGKNDDKKCPSGSGSLGDFSSCPDSDAAKTPGRKTDGVGTR